MSPVNTAPLTPQEIAQLFDSPGDVPANTFELSLVLGGTVSAGAYTAGVMDFLIDALDTWSAARDGGEEVPSHHTMVRFLCGTSGGGVCAAIASRALNYNFPPVRQVPADNDAAVRAAGNPFYDTWVNGLDLRPMLDIGDLPEGAQLVSLLNGNPVRDVSHKAANFVGPAKATPRAWVAAPLRVFLTLTNLNGIPCSVTYGTMTSENDTAVDLMQQYTIHADFARFAVVYDGRVLTAAATRPDEFVLRYDADWTWFGDYGLSTAAFPIGLPARTCERPTEHYKYRLYKGTLTQIIPDWERIEDAYKDGLPDTLSQSYVDGGVCDNEPIELARTALAGVSTPNKREGQLATRAVLLIDPFAGEGSMLANVKPDVIDTVTALIPAMLQELRYGTQDIALAAAPDVYSRFMIAASRADKVGNDALATAGFSAFIGFACKEFREHDYFLGRRNCQQYLQSTLILPITNKLFDAWRDKPYVADYLVRDGRGNLVTDEHGSNCLPIIPLAAPLRQIEQAVPWPVDQLNPADLRPLLEQRFARILSAEFAHSPLTRILVWFVDALTKGAAADYIIKAMDADLVKWNLKTEA